jgi:hypothetical protein
MILRQSITTEAKAEDITPAFAPEV